MKNEKKEKTLEELTNDTRRSITFPQFEELRDYITKALSIARKYDPNGKPHQAPHASGVTIFINKVPITVCKKRVGSEEVISKGVLHESLVRMSQATGIHYDQLELYFLGSGKPYKRFKRRFKERYGL